MKRRDFIARVAGLALIGATHSARAQQPSKTPRIGVLMGLPSSDSEGQRWLRKFIQTLRETGWRNGTNVQIDLRWASDIEQARAATQQLLELQPDVMQVTTAIATAEVLRRTRTIPVVFSMVNDPVGSGFLQNLSRPEGNATGVINIEPTLGKRWLELLKEIDPRITRVALLFNPVPGAQFKYHWAELEAAAASLGLTATAVPARDLAEIEKSLVSMTKDPGAGVVVIPDPFFDMRRAGLITSLVLRRGIVGVYPFRDFAMAGGLVSYSVDFPDLQRAAAVYVDRILRGAKPADLPVQTPAKFELVINLRTATSLGLRISPSLLARASEVIE